MWVLMCMTFRFLLHRENPMSGWNVLIRLCRIFLIRLMLSSRKDRWVMLLSVKVIRLCRLRMTISLHGKNEADTVFQQNREPALLTGIPEL